MAELDHFAQTWSNPLLALIMSVVGYLFGLVLAAIGRGSRGRGLVVAMPYLAMGAGTVAIWWTNLVSLFGHKSPAAEVSGHADTAVGVDPVPIVISIGGTLALLGAGLVLTGYGRPALWRLPLAGSCIGASLAITHYLLAASAQAVGSAHEEPTPLIVPGTVAVAAAAATLRFATGSRSVWATALSPAVVGTATTAAHFVGVHAVGAYLGSSQRGGLTGVEPLLLVGPSALVGAAVAAALAFFSLAGWPRRELRHDVAAGHVEIEPRIIEEVTSRVAVAITPPDHDADRTAVAGLPVRRPVGPRPTPGNAPTWQSMPVWGAPEAEAQPRAGQGLPSADRAERRNAIAVAFRTPDGSPATAGAATNARRPHSAPVDNTVTATVPSRYPPGINARWSQPPDEPRTPERGNDRRP